MKAEHDNPGLPKSNEPRDLDDSSHITNKKDLKKAPPKKIKTHHLDGSGKAFEIQDEFGYAESDDEESEDEDQSLRLRNLRLMKVMRKMTRRLMTMMKDTKAT